jgi:hypothetical protein
MQPALPDKLYRPGIEEWWRDRTISDDCSQRFGQDALKYVASQCCENNNVSKENLHEHDQ